MSQIFSVSSDRTHATTQLSAGVYIARVKKDLGGGEYAVTEWSPVLNVTNPSGVQPDQDLDLGTGKILYSNVYQTLADLPDAASYHGMFAHVHAEGAAYYAHAGNWVRLADNADIPTFFVSGLNGLSGSVILAGGSNVQIGQSGNQLTISSTQTFSTLNGESGSLSLVGGEGVSVTTVDGVITVSSPVTAATRVNQLTGNVGIVAGDNINVATSGQNVVISGQSGGVSWGNPPTDPGDPGNPGDVAYDDNYLYVHTSQGWRRATLGSWNPTITLTIQPQDLSLELGQSGNFTVAAAVSDGSSPSYQWQTSDDNGSTWDTITGANTTTYSLSGVSIADNGTQYRAVVSALGAVDVTSSVASLTVTETFRLLIANGDTLLTEAGETLNHDGAATGGGNDPGPEPSGDWEEVSPQLNLLGGKYAYSPDSDTAYLLVNTTSSGGYSVIGAQKYERDAQNGTWVPASNAKNTGHNTLESVDSIAASKDGSRVIVTNEQASPTDATDYSLAGFTVYEEQNGTLATVYSGSQDTFSQVAISGDGSVFASYEPSVTSLRAHDASGTIGLPLTAYNAASLALNNDGTRIAFSEYDDVTGDGNADSFSRAYLWTGSSWVQLGSDFISPANVLSGQPRQPLAFNDAGDRIAVGYSTATGNFTESGIVRVYDWDGSAWQQVGSDISGEAAYDLFGSAVALSESGSRLIVGARGHDSAAGNAGRSYIYEWSGSTWAAVGNPIDGDATTNIYFGDTAHISSDGTRVAASAPGADNGNGTLSVYELEDNQITITQQPQNVTYSGSPVVFSANATVSDNSSPSYLWQSSADNGSTWANLSGETASNLTISGVTGDSSGNQYRAVISAARAPSATTDNATLTVT
jgi:hypothetical protein